MHKDKLIDAIREQNKNGVAFISVDIENLLDGKLLHFCLVHILFYHKFDTLAILQLCDCHPMPNAL